jgi:hypothetical protein
MTDSEDATAGASDDDRRQRLLAPRTKASVLWGVVGAMAFLVLVQGYELLFGPAISLVAKAGVTLVVTVATAGSAHVVDRSVSAGNERS